MSRDKNTTLSHLYGIAGLVPGLIGLVYLVKTDAHWQEYALLASGWVTAIFYALMLVRCFSQSRSDGEQIGELKGQVKALENSLIAKEGLLTYLSGVLMSGEAKPRKRNTEKPINLNPLEAQP